MTTQYRLKQASQQEINLYLFLGEAVCAIQHVEDALSHSIALKKSKTRLRSEGDKLLKEYRSYTLGKAIKAAKETCLYPEALQQELTGFLAERNWLIHKSIAQNRDEWDLNINREKLLCRIKDITTWADKIRKMIEDDLIDIAENKGINMDRVRAEIEKYYSK